MLRRLFLCVMVTLLAGCAKTLELPAVTDASHEMWQARQLQLAALNQWNIRGRIALFVDDKVYNLGLGWQRQGERSNIKLETSLGQGVIRLKKDSTGVELTTSEGEQITGINAQQVLYRSTGLVFPVEGLETWIKGIPHEASYYLPDIDGLGRAMTLGQDGWGINYFDYEKVQLAQLNQAELPQKIYMRRDNLALKIVIDQWQKEVMDQAPDIFPIFPE